jgi:hypothetical protein
VSEAELFLNVDESEPCATCGHILADHPQYADCMVCRCSYWALFSTPEVKP